MIGHDREVVVAIFHGKGDLVKIGLLFHEIGHVPELGATKEINGLVFEVLSVERQRIDRVRISGLSAPASGFEDRAG